MVYLKSSHNPLAKKRGQAAITDLFIAVAIFIVLITITTLIWNLYNSRLQSRLDYDTMVLKGYHIVDALVKSRGYPEDWETLQNPELSTTMFGLADYDHVISGTKIDRFAQLSNPNPALGSYTALKNTMKISLYEYRILLKAPDNKVVFDSGKIPAGKFTVNLARFVFYNGQPHILEFAVWK